MHPSEVFLKFQRHRLYKPFLSILIVAVAGSLQFLLWPWIKPAQFLLFYPAIIISSLYANGTLALLLSAVATQYFFTQPEYSLQPTWPQDYVRLLVFFMGAFMIRNITYHLAVERIKAEANAEDLKREREGREEFVATLTHDLHTPLTAAKLNVQMLMRKSKEHQDVIKSGEKILANINRIDEMIHDLLDSTKIKAGKGLALELTSCDLNDLIKSTINDLTSIHGARFITQNQGHIRGQWNPEGIRRILENLCSNAIKYGSPNTPITVKSEVVGNKVSLSVHNFGNPIPREKQEKLFDPFMQAEADDSKKRGWGLGLTLVKGITEAHGGKVELESTPESGTTFKVWLPYLG